MWSDSGKSYAKSLGKHTLAISVEHFLGRASDGQGRQLNGTREGVASYGYREDNAFLSIKDFVDKTRYPFGWLKRSLLTTRQEDKFKTLAKKIKKPR